MSPAMAVSWSFPWRSSCPSAPPSLRLTIPPPPRPPIPPPDPRAQRAQPFINPLVSPLDLAHIVDGAGTLGGQRREEHSHAGPDVRRLDYSTFERGGPRYHSAVRVTQHDTRPHADELVHEEEAGLEHLLEDQEHRRALGRGDDGSGHDVSRERGPGPVLQLGYMAAEVGPD